jgi:hypothetical protein
MPRGGPAAQARHPPAAALAAVGDGLGVAELLKQIVTCLVQSGRLAREHGLTHRELIARSTLETQMQRAALAQLAGSAELLLYGPPEAKRRDFSPVIAEGRGLLTQLSRAPGSA